MTTLTSPVTGMEFALDRGTKRIDRLGPREEFPSYDSGRHTRHGLHFDDIVNAVDDLGWDPDGNETVDVPTDNNILIEIPSGTYQLPRTVMFGIQNWGMVGIDEDVTLQPPEGAAIRMFQMSFNDPSENILLENITFDQHNDMESGIELVLNVTTGLEVHHCERIGKTPNRYTANGPLGRETWGMVITLMSENGEGTVAHWTDHCETVVVDYPFNAASIFSGIQSHGTLTVRDTSIKNQGEHAIYASKAWNVHLEHCEFVDNVNTNCRIAGEGSYVEDTIIGFQRDREYTRHKDDKPGYKATKIFRWENSQMGTEGGRITNCHLFCETDGLAVSFMLLIMGNSGGITIEDTTFENNSTSYGVQLDPLGSGWRGYVPDVGWVEFNNSIFKGDSQSPAVDDNRNGAIFNNCEFDMPNSPGVV